MQMQDRGLFDTNATGVLSATRLEKNGFSPLQWAILSQVPRFELMLAGCMNERISDMRLILDLQASDGLCTTLDFSLFSPTVYMGRDLPYSNESQDRVLVLSCKNGHVRMHGKRTPLDVVLQCAPPRDGQGALSLGLSNGEERLSFFSKSEGASLWMKASGAPLEEISLHGQDPEKGFLVRRIALTRLH